MENVKKAYLCRVRVMGRRSPLTAWRVCVVYAESRGEAEEKAWEMIGSDYAYQLRVLEVPEDGADFYLCTNPYV